MRGLPALLRRSGGVVVCWVGEKSACLISQKIRGTKKPLRKYRGGSWFAWLGFACVRRGFVLPRWAGFVEPCFILSSVYGFWVGGYRGIVGFIHCGSSPSIIFLSASSSLTRIEYLSSVSLLACANFPSRVRSIPDWVASSLMLTSLNIRNVFRLLGFGLIMVSYSSLSFRACTHTIACNW